MTRWAMAFSFNLACLPLGMVISGKLADAKSPRLVIGLGGFLFGLGMLLTGFAGSFAGVMLCFGLMMGIGSGAAYGAIVATSVRWFPDRRGLAGGLSVGALGCGTLVIAPVAQWLMSNAPGEEIPVMWAFKVLGLAFLIIIVAASFLMSSPPANFRPKGWNPPGSSASASGNNNLAWRAMLMKPEFWILFAMYACGAFSGLMVISQASLIAQKMARLTPGEAVLIVMFMGLANALGRVFWGFVSDKIGRLSSLMVMFALTALTMFILPELAREKNSLLLGGMIIGACFGGYLGTFPSVCADYFGTRNLTVNYALLFAAFSVAAIAGPMAAGRIETATGTYVNAFIVAGILSLAGCVLTALAAFIARRRKIQTTT